MVKSAVTAASATWNQVNQASHQMVEMAEANVENATNAAQTVGNRKAA